jgi:hypothetical protein
MNIRHKRPVAGLSAKPFCHKSLIVLQLRGPKKLGVGTKPVRFSM